MILALVIIIAISAIILYYIFAPDKKVAVEGYCGHRYFVCDSDSNVVEKKAADLLCKVNDKCITLLNTLSQLHPDDPRTKILLNTYDWHDLTENPREAYNLGKGEKIHLCLKNGDNDFIDDKVKMYVVLHELAHSCTESYSHNSVFWKNFQWLTGIAVTARIYRPRNYTKFPANYCGLNITN